MDKKSKIFLVVFFLLIVGSVGATYWRIFVKKNYIIENQVDCDPYVDACFIWECDPESTVEGEACTGDEEADIWYYQIARRKAFNIPLCDPEKDDTCDPWTCAEDEKDCETIFCSDDNKGEQEAECNDPVQYSIDNPEEDSEAVECEEGDESCLEITDEDLVECEEGDEECLATEEEAAASEEDAECDPAAEDCSEDTSADSEEATE